MYAAGLKKYGELPEMKELVVVHAETHNIANKIIRMVKDGNKTAAEIEYVKLESLSKEIVGKLTALAVKLST